MNAILVLDDVSRERVKSNVSTLISRGIVLINSLSEITTQTLEKTNTVFILEGLLQQNDGFAELKFYKATLGLNYIFLMQKSRWEPLLRDIGRIYKTDIINLDFTILQAAMFDDKSQESTDCTSIFTDTLALAKKISADKKNEYTDTENTLANAFVSMSIRESATNDSMNEMKLYCERLESENAVLRSKNDAYMKEYSNMFAKATQLNTALSQYEVVFTKDIYTKLDLYEHSERPAIIYIKECEWLNGFDKLIETVFNTVRIQNRQSIKVLRLFDSSSSRRLLTLPKYYKIIKNKYKMVDVDANDFVCKTGDYVRILDSLLLNRMHLDVLLIVDSKDHSDTVLSGSHIIFNTCGRLSSVKPLRLSPKNTITNSKDGDLYWDDFNTENMTKNEAFIYLSSQPVIGTILQSLSTFEGYDL